MINKKIAIAILARDCNNSLKNNIPEVEKLREHFMSSIVIVIENDSIDGTKETLQKWSKTKRNVILLSKDTNENTIPAKSNTCPFPPASLHRIERMAKFRNLYLDYINSNGIHPDYLIVIDIDVKKFNASDIVQAIEKAPHNWGGIFAYGQINYYDLMPFMYDLFAYLPKEYINKYDRKTHEIFKSGQEATNLLKNTEYLECASAFGGIGIYKWDLIKNLHYKAIHNNRSHILETVCEHIPLNLKILETGKKNYISKTLKVVYGQRTFKHMLIYSILPYSLFSCLYRLIKRRHFEEEY